MPKRTRSPPLSFFEKEKKLRDAVTTAMQHRERLKQKKEQLEFDLDNLQKAHVANEAHLEKKSAELQAFLSASMRLE